MSGFGYNPLYICNLIETIQRRQKILLQTVTITDPLTGEFIEIKETPEGSPVGIIEKLKTQNKS